jgi:hypothetical protein
MKRAACKEWPRLLNPEAGCYPLIAEHRATERILHLALRNDFEKNPGVARAFKSIAEEYREVDWRYVAPEKRAALTLCAAREIRPTLVFLQLQDRGVFMPGDIVKLRQACDPTVVICNWDGDQHYDPPSPQRQWFADLGRVCDASLVPNTRHPAIYAGMGVRHPGYLQVAIDPEIYRPAPPAPGVQPVVCLATCYGNQLHQRRTAMLETVKAMFPGLLGLYGGTWGTDGHPMLLQTQEAPVYAAARAALSISIRNDLPRYSSDRLFRMLASGAVCLVEAFPDCEGLGLLDGINCMLWSDLQQLEGLIRSVLDSPEERWLPMRQAAVELSVDHTWVARFHELLAIVDAVRSDR